MHWDQPLLWLSPRNFYHSRAVVRSSLLPALSLWSRFSVVSVGTSCISESDRNMGLQGPISYFFKQVNASLTYLQNVSFKYRSLFLPSLRFPLFFSFFLLFHWAASVSVALNPAGLLLPTPGEEDILYMWILEIQWEQQRTGFKVCCFKLFVRAVSFARKSGISVQRLKKVSCVSGLTCG